MSLACRPQTSAAWIVPLVLLAASPSYAQEEGPCTAAEYRQFDFWLGEWAVSRADDGEQVGANRITCVLNGCVIKEEYEGRSGYRGTSYNIYDRYAGSWHQAWVDNTGHSSNYGVDFGTGEW